MKAKLFSLVCFSVVFLSACQPTCKNLTPPQGSQNPSNTYTMRLAADVRTPNLMDETVASTITINGATYPMKQDLHHKDIFYYDYRMPEGQNYVSYYYTVHYKTKQAGGSKDHSLVSDLHKFELINRYAHSLEYDRGPVGTELTLSGRGFSPNDCIKLGNHPVPTRVVSSALIRFSIPLLDADKAYTVRIENENSSLHIGSFYIDAAPLYADREAVELNSGDTCQLRLHMDIPPLNVDVPFVVTTDIPDAIAIGKIILKAGQTEASLSIKALHRGQGTLFIEAKGFKELALPLIIIDSAHPQKHQDLPPARSEGSDMNSSDTSDLFDDLEDTVTAPSLEHEEPRILVIDESLS